MGGGESPGSVRRKWDGLPDGDRAGRRGQKRRRAALILFFSAGRGEVQEHHLVAAGARAVVGARGLTAVVRGGLGRPADVVLRVVLEPVGRGGGRDHRQVVRDVLRDRGQRGGLRPHIGGGAAGSQC